MVIAVSATPSESPLKGRKISGSEHADMESIETNSLTTGLSASEEGECDACPYCADTCEDPECYNCLGKQDEFPARPSTAFGRKDVKYYTPCQVRRHACRESAWLLVGDTIYDATTYISRHPGGEQSILKKSGGVCDCSIDFNFHSKRARKMWRDFEVGKLCPCSKDSRKDFGSDDQCVIS
mmetsp:Transcript_7322/g.16626  ORF Transcript_7322/g.16626 Transcript_7322/m.16626 type:complete len:181 (-) Transcript_7322:141-683(-)